MSIGRLMIGGVAALLLFAGQATASYVVHVQPILTADDDGSNVTSFFGGAEGEVKAEIDAIWSQAGISVAWFDEVVWNSSWARVGDTALSPRPDDFPLIFAEGADAGVAHTDPSVIDMYFLDRLPNHDYLPGNTAAGEAWIGQPGMVMAFDDNLLTFANGIAALARVIAHEIGHNLGLPHYDVSGNLMHTDGNYGGSTLTASQIDAVMQSDLVTFIPEPATAALLLGGAVVMLRRPRR